MDKEKSAISKLQGKIHKTPYSELFKYLYKKGAYVISLYLSIKEGSPYHITTCIAKLKTLKIPHEEYKHAFWLAIRGYNEPIINELCSKLFKYEDVSEIKDAFWCAIRTQNTELVATFLEKHDINQSAWKSLLCDTLVYSVKRNAKKIVNLIIDKAPSLIEARNYQAFMWTATLNDPELLNLFTRSAYNSDIYNVRSAAILRISILLGKNKIVIKLLKLALSKFNKINIFAHDNESFVIAVEKNAYDVFVALIDYMIKHYTMDKHAIDDIYVLVARTGRTEMLTYLLEQNKQDTLKLDMCADEARAFRWLANLNDHRSMKKLLEYIDIGEISYEYYYCTLEWSLRLKHEAMAGLLRDELQKKDHMLEGVVAFADFNEKTNSDVFDFITENRTRISYNTYKPNGVMEQIQTIKQLIGKEKPIEPMLKELSQILESDTLALTSKIRELLLFSIYHKKVQSVEILLEYCSHHAKIISMNEAIILTSFSSLNSKDLTQFKEIINIIFEYTHNAISLFHDKIKEAKENRQDVLALALFTQQRRMASVSVNHAIERALEHNNFEIATVLLMAFLERQDRIPANQSDSSVNVQTSSIVAFSDRMMPAELRLIILKSISQHFFDNNQDKSLDKNFVILIECFLNCEHDTDKYTKSHEESTNNYIKRVEPQIRRDCLVLSRQKTTLLELILNRDIQGVANRLTEITKEEVPLLVHLNQLFTQRLWHLW